MVGAWRPQRASAELSIFPAYGRAVHTLPGWLHSDMETLILVTLNVAQGHALSSLYWIVPLHLLDGWLDFVLLYVKRSVNPITHLGSIPGAAQTRLKVRAGALKRSRSMVCNPLSVVNTRRCRA